ncbi:MAG: DUF6290 family protein [Acidithiobacillus sp.]|nr:DUF6290 family protein [Acidithiobacillus sp.]
MSNDKKWHINVRLTDEEHKELGEFSASKKQKMAAFIKTAAFEKIAEMKKAA